MARAALSPPVVLLLTIAAVTSLAAVPAIAQPSSNVPVSIVLAPPAGQPGDQFGHAVAMLGTRVVVGAPGDDERGLDAGAAYVFVRRDRAWSLEAKLAPAWLSAGDAFGSSVAIARDVVSREDVVAVGAPGDDVIRNDAGLRLGIAEDRGAVYVFQSQRGAWSLDARLQLPRDQELPSASSFFVRAPDSAREQFGASVSITVVDGVAELLAGAPGTDLTRGGVRLEDAGEAYGYRRGPSGWVFESPSLWYLPLREPVASGRFGAAMSAGFVGEPGGQTGAGAEASSVTGVAYQWGIMPNICTPRFCPQVRWAILERLAPSGEALLYGTGSAFGTSIAGTGRLVGAPHAVAAGQAGVRAGAAWVYRDSTAAQPHGYVPTVLMPPSPREGLAFGASVAVGDELALVGSAPTTGDAPEPVWGFAEQPDLSWAPVLQLQAPADASDRSFGSALAATDDLVAVGAPASGSAGAIGAGRVVVFDLALRDRDGDGLPDRWEAAFGLDGGSGDGANGPTGDPDGDGVVNRDEYAAQTHPTGDERFTQHFAEGASTDFFASEITVANPGDTAARVLVRYMRRDGAVRSQPVEVPAMGAVTVTPLADLDPAEFSTTIESDALAVAGRVMSWPRPRGLAERPSGRHAERAVSAAAATWYFAEGATHSGFDLFYLLQNPASDAVDVRAKFLRPAGPPLEKVYRLPPRSRTNIWVDFEPFDTPDGPRTLLDNTDVAAVFETVNGAGIIAERAMYLTPPEGRMFEAGHESAGVTAPATSWYLAEGATGEFFDTFVLLANPTDSAAEVRLTYLTDAGQTWTRDVTLAPNTRFNVWVDLESFDGGVTFPLAATAFATTVASTNGVPVVVERAMWWPGPTAATWAGAHNAFASTEAAARWLVPLGRRAYADTYLLIGNPTDRGTTVKVTAMGGSAAATTVSVPAHSRVSVRAESEGIGADALAVLVESMGPDAPPIVVEQAIYTSESSRWWSGGSGSLGWPLP